MQNLPKPAKYVLIIAVIILNVGWFIKGIIENSPFEPAVAIVGQLTIVAAYIWNESRKEKSSEVPQSNRDILIQNVQNNWIDGVLKDALRDAQIDIDAEMQPHQVGDNRNPDTYTLQYVKRLHDVTSEFQTVEVIPQVFKDCDQKLLILGAPGSGKTVLMLQLAEQLLEQARQDKGKSIPIIVNLSSWAQEQKSLQDWLMDELERGYSVNEAYAEELINGDSLIYFLDGLDEVARAYRDKCLNAINAFISTTRQLVICSRSTEYQNLTDKLKTRGAIELKPLTREQANDLLKHHIPELTVEEILHTLQVDQDIWQEANKPLFFNILIATYRDGKPFIGYQGDGSPLDVIKQSVIEPYLTRQLQNKAFAKVPNNDILRYLSWISKNLNQRKRTIFYIEMLQPDWLTNPKIFKFQIGFIGLSFALSFFLGFGILIGLSSKFHIDQLLILNLKQLNLRIILIGSLFIALIGGLIDGLIMGLIDGGHGGRDNVNIEQQLIFNLNQLDLKIILSSSIIIFIIISLSFDLISGLIIGLSFGLIFGLSQMIKSSQISQRNQFNQGLKDTLISGLVFGLIGGSIGSLISILISELGNSIGIGLIVGIIVGLGGGVSDVIKHLILRRILYKKKLAPKRYDQFLLHVVDRRIMRRVGGGAMFIHRYILEYFTDKWEQQYAKDYPDG